MNWRLYLGLSTVLVGICGSPALAFKVDHELSRRPERQLHGELFQKPAVTQSSTVTLPGSVSRYLLYEHKQDATGLMFMFNLPTVDTQQNIGDIHGSANFYFNLSGTDRPTNSPGKNLREFSGWVECEGCRSIFDLGYEKFLGCGQRLFFGWC